MFLRLKLALAGAAAAALAGLGIWAAGKREGRQRASHDATKGELETHRRINDADTGSGDADADREWLRRRGQQ